MATSKTEAQLGPRIPAYTKVMIDDRPGRWMVLSNAPTRIMDERLYYLRRLAPAPALELWVSDKHIQIIMK